MIVVVGENVVDLLAGVDATGQPVLRPALGGGPANTAVAAARLGAPVAYAGRFGRDAFAVPLRARQVAAGVDLRHAVDVDASTALAVATVDESGVASYDFWLDGAADFADVPLPGVSDGDIVHVGSLAAYWPPGADALERWLAGIRDRVTISFDVNLRPVVLARHPSALDRLRRLIALAHVVKASEEDLQLAFPTVTPMSTAASLSGPDLVVLTRGATGMAAFTPGRPPVTVPAPSVDVADTIGAGDAAMGALLASLHDQGIDVVATNPEPTLHLACAVAAIACTRRGAYAPTREDLT